MPAAAHVAPEPGAGSNSVTRQPVASQAKRTRRSDDATADDERVATVFELTPPA